MPFFRRIACVEVPEVITHPSWSSGRIPTASWRTRRNHGAGGMHRSRRRDPRKRSRDSAGQRTLVAAVWRPQGSSKPASTNLKCRGRGRLRGARVQPLRRRRQGAAARPVVQRARVPACGGDHRPVRRRRRACWRYREWPSGRCRPSTRAPPQGQSGWVDVIMVEPIRAKECLDDISPRATNRRGDRATPRDHA